jgi:hypothetical protein
MATVTTLSPIRELAPGQVSAIRNSVIDSVVAKASRELSLPEDKLVVREIRPYTDLGLYGVNTVLDTASAADRWGSYTRSASMVNSPASGGSYVSACTASKTIADDTYVVVYGVRDMRGGLATVSANAVTLIKFNIGNADRAIWDLTKAQLYYDSAVAISSAAVVMPPLAPIVISLYLHASNVEIYLQLMGFVVEPVGKVITP